jgi:hypothetical protein
MLAVSLHAKNMAVENSRAHPRPQGNTMAIIVRALSAAS